ncbi:MAG TPA: hypothetical protein VHL53_08155, partial [Acidimicrobiia bacterium]|nr:hypothetical protein [Acidimicrobiia bacterium]
RAGSSRAWAAADPPGRGAPRGHGFHAFIESVGVLQREQPHITLDTLGQSGFVAPARQSVQEWFALPQGCTTYCDWRAEYILEPAATGQVLRPGTYFAGPWAADHPADQRITFRLIGDHLSCDGDNILVHLDDIAFTDTALDRLAFRFEGQQCGVFGGLTSNSPVNWAEAEVWPKQAEFGAMTAGDPNPVRTIRVENDGPGKLPVDHIALDDPSGAFTVTDDRCTGTTVAAGGACTVAVALTGAAPGEDASATLRIFHPDAPADGHGEPVALHGSGPGPDDPLIPTFGDRGLLTDYALRGGRIAPLPDGRFVVAGGDGSYGDNLAVARYLADGERDTTFGDHGVVVIRTPGYHLTPGLAGVGVDAAGRVTVAGDIATGDPSNPNLDLLLVRLRPDGSPDPTFGTGGRVQRDLGGAEDAAWARVDPDGSVLVAGVQRLPAVVVEGHLLVARFLPTGALDPAFGPGGYATADVGANAELYGFAEGPTGAFYAVGNAGGLSFLAGLLPNGHLDPTFGSGGVVFTATDSDRLSGVLDVGVAPDGTVLVQGGEVGRYSSTGHLLAVSHLYAFGGVDRFGAMTVLPDGRILLSGGGSLQDDDGEPLGPVIYVARLRPDLTFDPTFGFGGLAGLDAGAFDGTTEGTRDVVVAPDGSVLAVAAVDYHSSVLRFRASFDDGSGGPGPDVPDLPGLPGPPDLGAPPGTGRPGYWMVGSDGVVTGFGLARAMGNAPTTAAVDLEPTPSGEGYWVVDAAGHVFAFGDAPTLGQVPAGRLSPGETATSLSATPTGRGYWIFTSRGRVLTFGDAPFLGDMSAQRLNGPVLDSVPTPSGRGYYMVAADGGIFSFGDAAFRGSMGGKILASPVQSLVPDATGRGYWLVAGDGGVFAFGDAPFRGSLGGLRLAKPVTGMVRAGTGYLMVGEDGGIFDFSGTPDGFQGSLGDHPPARPIVAVAMVP